MARKRYTPEQIIGILREAEVRLSHGEKIGEISRARRLKDLKKENQRLRKAVSDLTLDALILKEVVEGKY